MDISVILNTVIALFIYNILFAAFGKAILLYFLENNKTRHAYRIGLKNSNHSKLNLICTNTNKEYKGVKDACIDFGYSYGHLHKMINGERFNTTSLKRL